MRTTRLAGTLTSLFLLTMTVGSSFAQTDTAKKPVESSKTADIAVSTETDAMARSKALYDQGATHWNDRKFAEAKQLFLAAVKADPTNALAYYMLGAAHVLDGEFPAARAAYEEYLQRSPNGSKAAQVRANLRIIPN